MALAEFNTANRAQKPELFVYSDVCRDSFIGTSEQPLLRRIVYDNKDQNNIIYDNPYYVPIKLKEIQQIHIYIKDDKGQDASFRKGIVTVTLHFKKFPFVL